MQSRIYPIPYPCVTGIPILTASRVYEPGWCRDVNGVNYGVNYGARPVPPQLGGFIHG